MTDPQGRFRFSNLKPGTYLLRAAADGYSQEGASSNVQVKVVQDKPATGITFQLVPAGSLSGKVTGPGGQALAGIKVSALRPTYSPDGHRTIGAVQSAETNDRGEYRLSPVLPGHYYLVAPTPEYPASTVVLSSTSNSYLETLYPSATQFGGATAVNVGPGGDVGALDFHLVKPPTYHVRGKIVDSKDQPVTGLIALGMNFREPLVYPAGRVSMNSYMSGPSTFDIPGIPAGSYALRAQSGVRTRTAFVAVRDSDVNDVTLRLIEPVSIPVLVRTEGEATRPPELSQGLLTADEVNFWAGDRLGSLEKSADGTFSFKNLACGQYRVRVTDYQQLAQAKNIYVKSIQFGTEELLTNPLNVAGPVNASIVVVLSPGAHVDATIHTPGALPPRFRVALVPDDRNRLDLYRSGFASSARFNFRGVAPGSYKVFAWANIEQNSWFDPVVMRTYEKLGSHVSVADGGIVNVDTNLIPQ